MITIHLEDFEELTDRDSAVHGALRDLADLSTITLKDELADDVSVPVDAWLIDASYPRKYMDAERMKRAQEMVPDGYEILGAILFDTNAIPRDGVPNYSYPDLVASALGVGYAVMKLDIPGKGYVGLALGRLEWAGKTAQKSLEFPVTVAPGGSFYAEERLDVQNDLEQSMFRTRVLTVLEDADFSDPSSGKEFSVYGMVKGDDVILEVSDREQQKTKLYSISLYDLARALARQMHSDEE